MFSDVLYQREQDKMLKIPRKVEGATILTKFSYGVITNMWFSILKCSIVFRLGTSILKNRRNPPKGKSAKKVTFATDEHRAKKEGNVKMF